METYIASGLLEGHLLLRQRTLLEQEIAKVPEESSDLALGCLRCRNLLALGKAREAAETARELTRRFPGEEEPWLEMMRVCVDSRDAQGLRAVGEQITCPASVLLRRKMKPVNVGIEQLHACPISA